VYFLYAAIFIAAAFWNQVLIRNDPRIKLDGTF
jgi:hypothetical protein